MPFLSIRKDVRMVEHPQERFLNADIPSSAAPRQERCGQRGGFSSSFPSFLMLSAMFGLLNDTNFGKHRKALDRKKKPQKRNVLVASVFSADSPPESLLKIYGPEKIGVIFPSVGGRKI